MKKRSLKWLSLFLTTIMLSGCGLFSSAPEESESEEPTEQVDGSTDEVDPTDETDGTDTNDSTTEDVNQDLTAWIPRLDNVLYSYEGVGNEYATFTWYPQFNRDNYYQIATDNGGTVLVEIFEYRENEIVRTFQYPEGYFRDNFSDIGTFSEGQEEEIVLKTPIEVGTSWTSGETDYEITAINHEITVPNDTYETIEVTGTLEDGSFIKRYYAENIGLVSEISEGEGYVVESNLKAIAEDAAETIPFTVYIPDEQAMGMDTVNAELALKTNDPARIAIQELLTGKNADYPEVNILPEGTKIQYLFLNNDKVVEVDLSDEFVTNMNAGSTGELFFIYNLVNTLSQYYGTDEVLLTIDGGPYEGAHMVLDEGETLQFNEEMVNE